MYSTISILIAYERKNKMNEANNKKIVAMLSRNERNKFFVFSLLRGWEEIQLMLKEKWRKKNRQKNITIECALHNISKNQKSAKQ